MPQIPPRPLSSRKPNRITALRYALAAGALLAMGQAAAQNHIGMAVAAVPEYEGSEDYRILPIPLISYETEHFFLSPRLGMPAAGFKWSPHERISTGVFVSARLGRDADDAPLLRGLEDLDDHAVYGGYVAWETGRFSATATHRRATKRDYGNSFDLRLSYQVLQREHDTLTLGVGTEWADDDYMQTWFGITPEQAARSQAGLPAYATSAGIKSANASASWLHRFDGSRWSLLAVVGANALQGDARDSPLVERETAAFGSLGVIRAF